MESKLLLKIKNYKEIRSISTKLHKDGKKIVMITGCFDLLHFGHALFFEQAKKFGDILIVSLGSDKTIKEYKGPGRPIYNQLTRAGLIASQTSVDFVVIAKERLDKQTGVDYKILIEKVKPDIFVLRNDDSAIEATEKIIKKYGGRIKLVARARPAGIPYISTTDTIKKLSASR
ncbi:MAG: adenylyltransferase/cytidyltransferase family protein [Patescibacteria group bacterium]